MSQITLIIIVIVSCILSPGFFTFFDCVSKVDGNMLGKSFRATGSRNSMKGTMMKTRKGRSLKTSAHVLRN